MFNHSFAQIACHACIKNTARPIEEDIYRRFHKIRDRDCFGVTPLAMTTIICPLILYGSEARVITSVGRFASTHLCHATLISLLSVAKLCLHNFMTEQRGGRQRRPNRGLSNFASHVSSFVIPYRKLAKGQAATSQVGSIALNIHKVKTKNKPPNRGLAFCQQLLLEQYECHLRYCQGAILTNLH